MDGSAATRQPRAYKQKNKIRYTYRRGVLLDGHPQTLEQLVLHGRRQRRDHEHQLQQLRRQRRLQRRIQNIGVPLSLDGVLQIDGRNLLEVKGDRRVCDDLH